MGSAARRWRVWGALALACAAACPAPSLAAQPGSSIVAASAADQGELDAAPEARKAIEWVRASGDHGGQPVAIVDKRAARVFVFDASLRLLGSTPALVGLAVGDDSVPGIGDKKISEIKPQERTTPAGRFAASMGEGPGGEDILWVDYDGGVAIHRMPKGAVQDQRARRMASPDPKQRRITFGCVNVPTRFFEDVVARVFAGKGGVVYVLPETKPLGAVFAMDRAPR